MGIINGEIKKIKINNKNNLAGMYQFLSKKKVFSFDCETTGKTKEDKDGALHYKKLSLVGVSLFSYPNAYWIRVRDRGELTLDIFDYLEKIFKLSCIKIAHRTTFDVNVLYRYGINISPTVWCSKVMALINNENDLLTTKLGLKKLSEKYLDFKYAVLDFEEDILKYSDEEVFEYACNDAIACFYLAKFFYKNIKEKNLLNIFRLETELIPVIANMQRNGILINVDFLKEQKEIYGNKLLILEKEIQEIAECKFNLNSYQQLEEILYDKLNLPAIGEKTKTGHRKTDIEALKNIKDKHAIIEKLLLYSKIKKVLSTYIKPFIEKEYCGRIYPQFNAWGTKTGRFSSSSPNFQNLPREEDELSAVVKKSVIAPKNKSLIKLDYSQVEYRVLAHYCQDKKLLNFFEKGLDIHVETAKLLFNDDSKKSRNMAKTLNFAQIYGQSYKGLAKTLGVSIAEAKKLQNDYFNRFPRVQEWINEERRRALIRGYILTLFGRKRTITELRSNDGRIKYGGLLMAVNAIIQGSTADICKLALLNIHKNLVDEETKILITVHDEIVLECDENRANEIATKAKNIMEGVVSLSVPLTVDVTVCKNWASGAKSEGRD